MIKSDKLIEAFRVELLRWNKQINLVSRQDTEDRLDSLFHQCQGGLDTVLDVLSQISKDKGEELRLFYFDLGSGAGLPGVVWHTRFCDVFPVDGVVQTWLVEPREKRAWFLNRLNRIKNMPSMEILHGRWGDVEASNTCFSNEDKGVPVFIVSLKALYLDDSEVLGGLMGAFSSFPDSFVVVIARYYPPEQTFASDLVEQLQIPEQGTVVELGGCGFTAFGAGVRPLKGPGAGLASLVFSSYSATRK